MKKIAYGMAIIVMVLVVQNVFDSLVPNQAVDVSAEVTNSVEETFREYGINESLCQIEGYYYYGTRYMNDIRCIELLDNIAGELGINSAYIYNVENTGEGYAAEIIKEGEQFKLVIKSVTTEESISESVLTQRTYISVNLDIYNSIESGYYYKNKIDSIMRKICDEQLKEEQEEERKTAAITEIKTDTEQNTRQEQVRDNIYLVIKGEISGKMLPDAQRELGEKLIKRLGADKVFDSFNSDMYSLYAYNKSINPYVSIGKDAINVNVAFAYNELDNVTYVYVGSPIVNYDY